MNVKWGVRCRAILAAIVATALTGTMAVAEMNGETIEGARREGKLTWYTSMSIDDSQPLLDAFMKKYPFIKTQLWRGSSEKVLNKILTETRAGRFLFDLVALPALETGFLKASGLAQRYLPPSAAAYRKGSVDPEGYWVDIYDNYFVIGYNTNLVSRAEAPRDWQDLLAPKWKGKFAMDVEDYAWLMVLEEAWGQERVDPFMKRLAAQNIQWRKGHTLIAKLLVAGEFPLGLVYAHRIEELKKKGAPVEWVTTTDPIPVEVHPIQIAARAQNPNAAKLFVEFVASKEGQTMIKEFQRIPVHPDLKLDWNVNPRELKLHPVRVVGPERTSQLIKKWREIFNPTGS